jgi:hypothetical protein
MADRARSLAGERGGDGDGDGLAAMAWRASDLS